jgi:pimeloyl-ACP methyl ester carboxylesterase
MYRKRIRPVLFWVLGIYLVPGAALYMLQKKLIFHPDPLAADYKFQFDVPFEEIKIPVKKDEILSAVLFKAKAPKGIVIYFHGNARNISKYASKTPDFINHGYDVLMMDYPSFGKSTGPLVEAEIYANALHMYEMARQRFSPDSIIIYGRSLGSGVAAQLASIRDCRRLILEAPYYSMTDMANRIAPIYPYSLMLEYKFSTNEYLKKVTAPVTIIHGTDDHTVPISSGKKLEALFKPGDKFIAIDGADHNNLHKYTRYHQALDNALQ